VLDYEAIQETLSKEPGDDLAEGKPTRSRETSIAIEQLQQLPESEYRNALEQLAGNSVGRDY